MGTLEAFQRDLLLNINKSTDLIQTVNQMVSLPNLSVNLTSQQRDWIVGWAFVNIHATWECFLENCFLAYMLGRQTASGFAPVRFVYPNDEQHALGVILAGREFFRWSSPSLVKERSKVCFKNGEPFANGLDSIMTELEEMNTIRNAIVHQSHEALDKFKSLVRSKLLTAPLDITPGTFLLTAKLEQVTYFGHYCKRLRIAAKRIVPS